MKSRVSFLVVLLMLIGADAAADVIYSFVGQGGTSGTNWTLVDPSGYLTVPSGNVISLVQTATDLILVDPMTGPQDFGPLTNITVGNPPLQPDYYGITMGSSSFTLAALFIPKADFTTPGTYELADLSDLNLDLPGDQGTLTITETPEPSSVALVLAGVGLGLMVLMRKRNSRVTAAPRC
ncbi:MAG TPA: PEP-CTERM sorting domain-containing protein [Bryobacteraceae bacterium]|nr:PEP-CTERM sorting domain-containing protein [Bryobacteraceae bacterium]